jgi:hypothetical protein
MSAPKIVKTVDHRVRSEKGRTLGHVGLVQRRTTARMKKYGGKRWAAWARRTVDGVATGSPERFETYDVESEALAHAIYAAGQVTPTTFELMAMRRRMP